MRWLIGVIALAKLGCGADVGAFECPLELDQPVLVELLNADTERRISGASVRVTDGSASVELMELVRGQYGVFRDVPGLTVTATHADYHDATGSLTAISSECSYQRSTILRMTRKLPCSEGVAGVQVVISDEADGTPIAGAAVDLRDGIYSERMNDMGDGRYEGAYDRPGIYRIEAAASGYLAGTADSIWVEEDDCSVLTTAISLSLPRSRR